MRDGYQAAQRGDHLQAVVILSLTACEVAKPCYALAAPLRGISQASRALSPSTRTVIGRVKDLQRLNPGEQSLLPRLKPNLGSPRANWKRNAGVLRDEIRKGQPIRDASPDDMSGPFLNAERSLLYERGWRFDKSSGLWQPPTESGL
jgi:hypothetical protein